MFSSVVAQEPRRTTVSVSATLVFGRVWKADQIELGPSGTNQLILKYEELVECLLCLEAALLVIS